MSLRTEKATISCPVSTKWAKMFFLQLNAQVCELGVSQPARGEEVTYPPVCSLEALPELRCPNPALQSTETQTQDEHSGSRLVRAVTLQQAWVHSCKQTCEHCVYRYADYQFVNWCSYLIPGHWFCPEERAGEFYREAFLVVLGFVLWHTEQNCCSVGGWGKMEGWTG